MESYRIWNEKNLIYILVESTGRLITLHAKDTLITRGSITSTVFYLKSAAPGMSSEDARDGVDISNIKKENGDPYTLEQFIKFLEDKTGKP